MNRRNSDEKMRALEREALRSGDQDAVERLNGARVRAGLPAIPGGISAHCLRVILGVGPSALVRVGWDELVPHLDLEDDLIWFDGSRHHAPGWFDAQVSEDAGEWISDEWDGPNLTDDQRDAVRDQFLYALEPEWMPSQRITKNLIERWIVRPINADSGGFWNPRTDRGREFCVGTAISVEGIDDDSGQDSGVTFRVFEPFFVALFAHRRDDGRDLLVEKVTSEDVLEAASRSRDSGEVRVQLPEHPSWDYSTPSRETLEKAIRDAAPMRKAAPKKRKRKNMGRRNPTSESMAYDRDLKAGEITPAAIQRRLRQIKDELDDAIFFKRPEKEIASLRERVVDMEAVLAGGWPHKEGPAARHERLEQEAFSRAQAIEALSGRVNMAARDVARLDEDLRESIRMRDPVKEIERARHQLEDERAQYALLVAELNASIRGLEEMAAAAKAELAAAAPPQKAGPVAQRRTYDGRLLDDATAREIDRLVDMASRGSLTKREVQELMVNARRQYGQLQRSESLRSSPLRLGGERMEPDVGGRDTESLLNEIGLKLLILDHVLNTAFKTERPAPPPVRSTPRVRSHFMEDDRN